MSQAMEIIRDKLRHYPDHGATDDVVKYVLTGAELAIIHDALAQITPRAAITPTPDTTTAQVATVVEGEGSWEAKPHTIHEVG